VVEKFRIRRNFHKNGTFSCTPHQSAALTASPQGEAFATAYLTDKSEFSKQNFNQLSSMTLLISRSDAEIYKNRFYQLILSFFVSQCKREKAVASVLRKIFF